MTTLNDAMEQRVTNLSISEASASFQTTICTKVQGWCKNVYDDNVKYMIFPTDSTVIERVAQRKGVRNKDEEVPRTNLHVIAYLFLQKWLDIAHRLAGLLIHLSIVFGVLQRSLVRRKG